MENDLVTRVRKLSQEYAYTSLQMHETIARTAGMPGTDHKYLGFFLVHGEMTAGELAKHSGLTTGAVTGLIDRFEKRNLVKRQLDKEDRRKVLIVPNSKNIMAIFKPLYKEFRKNSEDLLASFSDKEMKVLETYFTRAIAIMTTATQNLGSK